MEWNLLKSKSPNVNEHGNKVLIYRIMNDSQALQAISIHETIMVKYCNPEETYWMKLPEPPNF